MPLPAFLCIGAQKSATSWLFAMLRQHPSIWMSPLKELHYFDRYRDGLEIHWRHRMLHERKRDVPPRNAEPGPWADYMDRVAAHRTITLDWYREIFSWPVGPGILTGDVTPAYMEVPEEAVAHARDILGDIKIMAIIRRPLDREMSQLRMWRTKKDSGVPEPETEAEWMHLYDVMLEEQTRGAYSNGIPLWKKYFSEANFRAIPFADIRERPTALMTEIEDFLAIPHHEHFRKLGQQIHKSTKVEIPRSVIDRAAERVADEDAFVMSHFGKDFYDRTK